MDEDDDARQSLGAVNDRVATGSPKAKADRKYNRRKPAVTNQAEQIRIPHAAGERWSRILDR
jgi:hypothetical protein